jgi:hypothetical protein
MEMLLVRVLLVSINSVIESFPSPFAKMMYVPAEVDAGMRRDTDPDWLLPGPNNGTVRVPSSTSPGSRVPFAER